jgi:hypothetical protein
MIFELITIFILLFIIVGLIYQFMFDIWPWVLLVTSVFYVSYAAVKIVYHYRRKEKGIIKEEKLEMYQKTSLPVKKETEKVVQKPKIDNSVEKLVDFINKSRKEGFKLKVIKDALVKQGWPKDKISKAIELSS